MPRNDETSQKGESAEGHGGIVRRELFVRLISGAGTAVALPALARAEGEAALSVTVTETSMQAPSGMAGEALGSAEPPDPYLKSANWKPLFFDDHQSATLDAISDLMIPDTDTPGAKAAQVNRFIDLLLSAEDADVQKNYVEALGWLDGHCLAKYQQPFVGLGRADQESVLTILTQPTADPALSYGLEKFAILKRSIVSAYYSSEIGMLQELRYQTNSFQPGYPGCKNPDEHGA
jgi:hypothetical protein